MLHQRKGMPVLPPLSQVAVTQRQHPPAASRHDSRWQAVLQSRGNALRRRYVRRHFRSQQHAASVAAVVAVLFVPDDGHQQKLRWQAGGSQVQETGSRHTDEIHQERLRVTKNSLAVL